MKRTFRVVWGGLLGAMMLAAAASVVRAQTEEKTGDLATAAQNPVADLISVPLQNNTFFGIGPDDDTANVLNIQPVIPLKLSQDWNLITRTIMPLIYVPDLTGSLGELPEGTAGGATFGLGDINLTLFASPARPGRIIWGLGPSLTFPTATDDAISSEKWSAGPSAVVLATPAPWVFGVLVRQLWSFAGDDARADVNQLLVQPFANYNLPGGWYLASGPVITANWEADSAERWNVPFGGGLGKIFRIGKQPLNASAQGFYHVEHPTVGPEWSFRFQLQFLFPK